MRMFSDCTGKCKECVAHFIGDCLAGHGDDDFQQITVEIAKALLNNPALVHRKDMILNKFPELKDISKAERSNMTEKKSKLGPAYKYGEPSVAITIRVPESVYKEIPEPKRDSIVIEVVKKFKKKSKK